MRSVSESSRLDTVNKDRQWIMSGTANGSIHKPHKCIRLKIIQMIFFRSPLLLSSSVRYPYLK